MGMTIKDAIHHLCTWSTTHGSGQTTDEQHEEAKKVAIDTMRKYQKIQEIINNAKDSDGAVKYNWLYEQIGEVVKDGKN